MDFHEADDFKTFYSYFYSHIPSEEITINCGIPSNLNIADEVFEIEINDQINAGIYNSSSITWKLNGNRPTDYGIRYRFYDYSNANMNTFCSNVSTRYHQSNLHNCDFSFGNLSTILECFSEFFTEITNYSRENSLPGDKYGLVQTINAIFFLTRGKLPIYDQFAHKAIRALSEELKPNDVYIGSNPNKNEISKITKMYKEYLLLLNREFPYEIYETEEFPYISRQLDQALWVYGHCTRSWDEINNNETTRTLLEEIRNHQNN